MKQRTRVIAIANPLGAGSLVGGGSLQEASPPQRIALSATIRRLALILLIALSSAACGSVPMATKPIDWQAADEHWSLHIVTLDPDGDERVTRIWLASADGEGTLRTGDSRWWQNLQRDADCRIRLDKVDYPVRAEFVTEHEGKVRIDEVFAEKYGWWERTMFRQERGETHENYARLRNALP
jgi:hypothetical protein